MKKDFLPRADGTLVTWTAAFAGAIAAETTPIGLDPADVARYADLQAQYADNVAPSATSVTRVVKDSARSRLVAETRRLPRRVRAAGVGDETLSRLKLLPPPIAGRVPADRLPQPVVLVTPEPTGTVVARIGLGRARPPGTVGAALFVHVGDSHPPLRAEDWSFRGGSRRLKRRLGFDAAVPPLARVWVTAAWIAEDLSTGPLAQPAGTYALPGLRIAA